jgi:hypothetical protein
VTYFTKNIFFPICKRYARISFELLTRPIATESEELANAGQVLAHVTYQLIAQNGAADGDILEAEKLFRKTVRIKERVHGRDNIYTMRHLDTLREILQFKGGHDDEVKDLSERYEAIHIKIADSDISSIYGNKVIPRLFK